MSKSNGGIDEYCFSATISHDSIRSFTQQQQLGWQNAHSRPVFSLVSIPPKSIEEERSLLSISMDRSMKLWNIDSRAAVWSTFGLGGFAYAIDESSAMQNWVAIAVGDKTFQLCSIDECRIDHRCFIVLFFVCGFINLNGGV